MYFNDRVINREMFEKTEGYVLQGEKIVLFLSNIMSNELDEELECRGHKVVRYASDCMVSSKKRKRVE